MKRQQNPNFGLMLKFTPFHPTCCYFLEQWDLEQKDTEKAIELPSRSALFYFRKF